MVKEIVKDISILTRKSEPFVFNQDKELIQDLIDTAKSNSANCCGLAAPQIGVNKAAIVVLTNVGFKVMINPVIFWKDIKSSYTAKESCLSVDGEHFVKRFRKIKVKYYTSNGKETMQLFDGFTAQIIQHEIDHLNGILI